AARPLTEARDAKVLVETLDELAARHEHEVNATAFKQARLALLTHQQNVLRRALKQEGAFEVVAKATRDARNRLSTWTNVPNRWRSLGCGLARVYAQAREVFAEVGVDPTTAKLHEWRKQVKYLRHQLEILEPLWSGVLGELVKQAHQLGQLLG